MKKNKILPSLRISTEEYEKMNEGINVIKENSLIDVSQSQYRRMALKSFSERLLIEGLTIEIKPE